MKKVKSIINHLFIILNREQKYYGIIVLVASLIGAVLETLGVSVIAPVIMVLLEPQELMSNQIVQKICIFLNVESDRQFSVLLICLVIILYLIKNGYFIFFSWLKSKYACKIQRELSVNMMKSYMERGYQYFTKHNTGELLNGVTEDTGSVYLIISNGFRVIVDILTTTLICIFMLMQSVSLAISVIVLAAICLLLILKVFRKAMLRSGDLYRKYNAVLHQALMHSFHGIKDVIILDKKDFFVKEYNDNYIYRQRENVKRTVAGESPAYIIEGLCISGLLFTVAIEFAVVDNPLTLVTALATFAVGAFRILPCLGRISAAMNTMMYSMEGLEAVYHNILEARKHDEMKRTLKEAVEEAPHFEHEIKITNLDFYYDDPGNKVLSGVDLSIYKGQSVAFIGASGAGKTTLADIILGLLYPQKGEILVDGQNVYDFGKGWNRLIGYVPQSVYLIDDTIRANVAFGERKEDIDEKKVWKALEQAQLADYVKGLEEGVDTLVGERGVRFSGGQRQRMAIARALYFEPQILVLDEATSALDGETEKAVMESIEALQGKITMIIVAHRLSTIRKCDVVYEIEKGKALVKDKVELFGNL